MPRSKRSKARGNSAGERVEVISGRSTINYASSSSNTLNIAPASFSRAAAVADVFQFYRFTKLKVILPPNGGTTTFGYAPGAVLDTAPTTNAAIMELPYASFHSQVKTMDTVLNVPRKELLKNAQLPWFKTIAGTPDAQFEIQGNLYSAFSATAGGTFVIEYTCEFQSWNLAGNSPLRSIPSLSGMPSSEIEDQKMVLVGDQKFRLVRA